MPLVLESISASGARTFELRVDAARSNFDRSLDWPILLSNAIEARRGELPGPVRSALAAGERFHWRGAAFERATLRAPGGTTQEIERLPSGDLLTPRLDQVGLWTLRPEGAEDDVPIGVSLMSALESDLRAAVTEVIPPADGSARMASMTPSDDLSLLDGLLLAIALAALALDWWVLQPRRRRQGART